MKVERKKQNKIDKSKVDYMKPINIDMFGSADDPCFGKHHSAEAKECGKCGDSEICMIISAQNQTAVREKIEAKGNYKDLEEVSIEHKLLEKYLIKLASRVEIPMNKAMKKVTKRFDPTNLLKPKEVKKSIEYTVSKSKALTSKKVENKTIIKIK